MKRRPVQLGVALALGVGLGLAGFVLAQQQSHSNDPPRPRSELPLPVTPDMIDVWCADAFGETYRASNLAGSDPSHWRCWGLANGITTEENVDMVNLCQQNFGEGVAAEVKPSDDVWECVDAPKS